MTKGKAEGIDTIGVIGAGQMGSGIAHVFALAGYHVLLHDSDADSLKGSLEIIRKNLKRQSDHKKISEKDAKDALARIKPAAALSAFSAADLVVESASENEEVKKDIFQKLCPLLKKEALLATNSSSLSVTRLAASTDRPELFMGVHFMNPVPVMQLVELVRGIATRDDAFNRIRDLILSLGKTPTNAEDFPAFIVNRILMPMINEAVYTLHEGVGTVESVDTAMRLGANHPMGPLELADFIGLDTCLAIMERLHRGLSDTKYRPCPLLVKYVEAGWLGRKTKRGFYDYSSSPPSPTR